MNEFHANEGETMSCRTTIRRCLLVCGGVLGFVTLARASGPGLIFELDGDVLDVAEEGIQLDDWNTLNGDCTVQGGGSGSPGSSSARTCIASEIPPRIVTTGGSKDPLDVSSWKWKAADTVPDKDTITHGFAASYSNAATGGDMVLVVGGDRFAVNGDANIGAWLFQHTVGLNANGTFSGVHVNQDVFLFSAFVGVARTAVLAVLEGSGLGSLRVCHGRVTTPCPCAVFHADGSGHDYQFSSSVSNDGGGTLFNLTVTAQGKTHKCNGPGPGLSKNGPSAD